MPRRALRLALLALAACGPATGPAAPTSAPEPKTASPAAETSPPWPFADTVLPAPPAQGKPTEGRRRAGLPEGLVSAVETISRMGLADPRGLPYHEATIRLTTQIEGTGEEVATRAFVLPAPEGAPRFGIAWNGLVYPLLSVGAPADLRADIARLRKRDRAICAKQEQILQMPCLRMRAPRAEIESHRLEAILPMHIAILVQLGEDTLARSLWEDWIRGASPEDTPEVTGSERAVFVRLAQHLQSSLRGRALAAHLRGEDALALASLRGLSRLGPTLAAHATRLGAAATDSEGLAEPPGPLLADQERRALAKRPGSPGLPAPLPTDPAARIAALVAALDDVREPVFGELESREQILEDPILQALLAEGEAAVEPLAEALATEDRWTRAMWYQRHGAQLLSVREVVEMTLDALARDLPLAPPPPGETLPQKAARFAEATRHYRAMPPEERWFDALADGSAGPLRWFDAATRIVQPSSRPRARTTDLLALFLRSEGPPPPRYAKLSSRKNPSVTELMTRRMEEIGAAATVERQARACEMGALLGLWDPKGGARALREETGRLQAFWKNVSNVHEAGELGQCLALLFVARATGGDVKALDEYATWVRGVDPARVTPRTVDTLLTPMASWPARPSIVAAGRAMFADKASPWAALFRKGELDVLLEANLLRVPGMRELVLAALEDRTVIGKIEIDETEHYTWKRSDADDLEEAFGDVDPKDPAAAPANALMPLRACDRVAHEMARRLGSSVSAPYRMYWKEARRDEAIAALRGFVVTVTEGKRRP